MKKTKRHTCGIGSFEWRSARDTMMLFKDEPALAIDEAFFVMTCTNCGELLIKEEVTKPMDAALERSWRAPPRGQ